ncbi:serine hydrolase domain-containing protein [Pseudaquabacterium pictum]|uniref:Serine hydrolase n=1 Tax=Pseudaquabacterium pictum TaxID=2315236 RepID=A0A480AJJ0_9BURK|nr:serine hydrolase [Rubrivivax pictus]GCL61804.1 serine hydrolase [Rubrivivax pictus]
MPTPPPHQLRHLARWLALATVAGATTGCGSFRIDQAARTATGFASHVLCDEVYITGTTLQRALDDRIRPMPAMRAVGWALAVQADPAAQTLQVTLAGGFTSLARFSARDGCQVLADGDGSQPPPESPPDRPTPDLPPDPDGSTPVPATSPRLQAALARALPEPADAHRTRAVLVLHNGRIAGERYAAGFGPDTPMLGFSLSKSVTNALVGILVQQGRLDPVRPGVLPAWQNPADPRHAITLEHLLRQTSGLDLWQNNSGFDPSAQIMYTVQDKAAVAAAAPLAAPPGHRWAYADTHYSLLSRAVRDAVGGDAAAVRGFLQTALFGPLGMRHARMDIDSTGTGMGAAHVTASARDWARFGQLFLDDGVVAGQRLLPPGWVAWSTTPTSTPTRTTGYGAGWWTNRQSGNVPEWGVPWGLPSAPADAFFGRGFMGQFVVVVPSRRLVVVRLASSHERGDDIAETDRIVADILAATAD